MNRCPRCGMRTDRHTDTDTIACAWRGPPCLSCGFPPHRDGGHDCARYDEPSDTGRRRLIRQRTPNALTFAEIAETDPRRNEPGYQEVLRRYFGAAASARAKAHEGKPAAPPLLPGPDTPLSEDW